MPEEKRDRGIAEGGEDGGSLIERDRGGIFAKGDVADPVPRLDRPMGAFAAEELAGSGPGRGETGDQVGHFAGCLPSSVGLRGADQALQVTDLLDTRPSQPDHAGRAEVLSEVV